MSVAGFEPGARGLPAAAAIDHATGSTYAYLKYSWVVLKRNFPIYVSKINIYV